uniref:Retroviral polymerase SH3-like domain-containing protein n=1 Tax=Tanacetum cinerariifolium TaxID=118510 RepID=A0A6L2KZE6_TANCI|nr:hypothetical protein [Tanacetum cinerariifolium]
MIDYALWEVIENAATFPRTQVVDGVTTVMSITTTKEKAQRRLEVKARSTLMMGIPNKHQLKFNSIKDAKQLLEAVEKRLCRNAATKKTQKNLLKHKFENFFASSSKMLDQSFDRLQKLVSQLELLGEKLTQEDVNQKLLRSFSSEWNTHVVVWRNKADMDTMSMDDLYNNLKVSDNEEENVSQPKIIKKIAKPSILKIEFVKSRQQEKIARKTVKKVKQNKKNTHRPRGNQRNYNNMMSQKLGNYKEIDGRYVAFEGNPKGGKITRKDHLGKFDGKANEGFFVRYSLNSKAFIVFNSRTRIVEENLHIRFSENTPNVVGSGVEWLFDIDALTRTMNYESIVDDGFKLLSDDRKKVDEDPRNESECKNQEKEDNVNSTNNIDSLLDEFAGELTLFKSISSRINETGCDPKEEIHLIKRLLYDNSSPRPPKEFISENSDAAIESFSPSPIPFEDNYCCSDGSLRDRIICGLNKTPDLSQRPPQNCTKCGNPVDGQYCQGCALLRKKFKEDLFTYCIENGIFQDFQDTFEPSNDNTNVVNALQEPFVVKQDPGENSSQSSPQINHHCCYRSNLVDDSHNIFNLQPPTSSYEFCGNDAYYGHDCSLQIPVCYNDDDDEDYTISIIPKEPDNSLSMGDEHLNTISAMESDKFIKFSVENLIPNPSEYEGEYECDVPACNNFTTFSNLLFDVDDDFSSCDDQSFYDEDIPKEIYSNPLNYETNCDREEEIRLIKRLLYDNSSPRPSEEFISKNSDTVFESFSPFHIPVEDSDSFMEEIDLSFTPDDPMPPGIEDDDYDFERDIFILEELLSNDSLSLLENESFHFDIPLSSRPLTKPPDGNSGILNVKVMGDISEHKGHEASQPSTECPMMICERNTPILDVSFLHFCPP